MSDPVLIIDNNMELMVIEHHHPELKEAPLILLSNHFSMSQLESYDKRGYTYFDESITENDENELSGHIKGLLWNWFLDSSGEDISRIDGCSMGCTFSSYLETMFTKLLCRVTGLKKLLTCNHTVYCSSCSDSYLLTVITFLQKEINYSLKIINAKEKQNKIATSRLTYFSKIFHHSYVRESICGRRIT